MSDTPSVYLVCWLYFAYLSGKEPRENVLIGEALSKRNKKTRRWTKLLLKPVRCKAKTSESLQCCPLFFYLCKNVVEFCRYCNMSASVFWHQLTLASFSSSAFKSHFLLPTQLKGSLMLRPAENASKGSSAKWLSEISDWKSPAALYCYLSNHSITDIIVLYLVSWGELQSNSRKHPYF